MGILAFAMICLFLYIIKGGPSGSVCILLFIGYCIYQLYKAGCYGQERRAKEDERKQMAEIRKKEVEEFHENNPGCAIAQLEKDMIEMTGSSYSSMCTIKRCYQTTYQDTWKMTGKERRWLVIKGHVECVQENDVKMKHMIEVEGPHFLEKMKGDSIESWAKGRFNNAKDFYNHYLETRAKWIKDMAELTSDVYLQEV